MVRARTVQAWNQRRRGRYAGHSLSSSGRSPVATTIAAEALVERLIGAKGFAQAFLGGQPHKATVASTAFGDKLSELRG
jgi:hypothetical protein